MIKSEVERREKQKSVFISSVFDKQICLCISACENPVVTGTLMRLCLCVILHPAWSVWWQRLPAVYTGELPSALPVGKGVFGTESNP